MPNQPPLYARFPGSVVAKPPCRMINANQYGFFVKGKAENIKKYVDETLNLAASGDISYAPLSTYTLLTFTDIENISSLNPEFKNQGWMQETDVIVWLPIAKLVKGKVDHIYWYPAFICVNNIYALVNGINVWGYNKYLCDCEMPAIGGSPDFFSLSVDAFQPFTPSTKMAKHQLIEVVQTKAGSSNKFSNFVDLVKEAFTLLSSEDEAFHFDLNVLKQMLAGFVHPQMDQILFKQFPDGDGVNAVYQNVVHSPSIIKKIHHAQIYSGEFEVILHQVDTFRLDQAFGLELGSQKAILPFNVLMDFDQEAATEIQPS